MTDYRAFARIEPGTGTVLETRTQFADRPAPPAGEGWVEVPPELREEITVRRWDGAAWQERAPVTGGEPSAAEEAAAVLAAARAQATAALIAFLDAQAERVTGPVPLAEKLTWDAKETAATRQRGGLPQAADHALLDAERAHTGETRDALAARWAASAAVFRSVGGTIAGTRRKALAAIAAAATPEAVVAAREANEVAFLGWLATATVTLPGVGPLPGVTLPILPSLK